MKDTSFLIQSSLMILVVYFYALIVGFSLQNFYEVIIHFLIVANVVMLGVLFYFLLNWREVKNEINRSKFNFKTA